MSSRDSVAEFNRLKEKVERTQRERDRAQGALDEVQRRLKEEFGCDSIAEGEKLLKKKRKEESKLQETFEDELSKFKEKWL